MSSGRFDVGAFLAHYASEYYDPAKAREYYLRTRELKNRQSTSDLRTDKQKQAWSYAKNQLKEGEKADVKVVSEERKGIVERARAAAQKRREEISESLQAFLESLSGKRSQESEALSEQKTKALEKLASDQAAEAARIREAAGKQIAALPKIPEGISAKRRAALMAQRAQKIAQIRGTVTSDVAALAEKGAAQREEIEVETSTQRNSLSEQILGLKVGERAAASVDREVVSAELKTAVSNARTAYENRRETLKTEYAAKTQSEFDAIRTRV